MTSSKVKSLISLTTGSIAILSLICAIGLWRSGTQFLVMFTEFLQPSLSTAKVDTGTIIVNRLRGVKELTTSVFVMETVVPTTMERKLGDLSIATTKLLYLAYGEVRAGVDLEKLTSESVQIEDNKITIQLPAPEILDRKIDVDRSRVYDYDRGFLGLGPDVGTELQTLAQRQTLHQIVTAACSHGILEEANHRAKLAIVELLTTAGYQEIEVRAITPAACN
jgi:hypothetical protein